MYSDDVYYFCPIWICFVAYRFHCLHGEMRMHPERVCVVIAAAAVLHNICIKKRIPLPRQEDVVPEVDENPAPAIPEDISGRLARNHIINNL